MKKVLKESSVWKNRLVSVILFTILFLTVGITRAQFSVSTYQMKDYLPQSNFMNPAFMPDTKAVIGLPGVSGGAFDGSAGFSFNDLFIRDADDSLVLDRDNFPSKLKGEISNSADAEMQIIYVGLKTANGYISLAARVRAENRFAYPAEFLQWAIWGPGDNRVNNTIDLENINAFGANYIEYSLSFAKRVAPKLIVGARGKYLSGISGYRGGQTGSIHVSSDSIKIIFQDSEMQMAGMSQFGLNPFSSTDKNTISNPFDLLNNGNIGFGVDVGVEVQVNDQIDLSASVTDVGFINWKYDINKYAIDDFEYSFKGFDFVEMVTNKNADLGQEADSLKGLIKPKELEATSFVTGLNGKMAISGRYHVGHMGTAGLTIYSGLNGGDIDPIIGLSYQLNYERIITGVAGITYRDRKIDNIMAGFVFKPGPVQLYVLSDRINSFLIPNNAHAFNLRAGINIVIGRSGSAVD